MFKLFLSNSLRIYEGEYHSIIKDTNFSRDKTVYLINLTFFLFFNIISSNINILVPSFSLFMPAAKKSLS